MSMPVDRFAPFPVRKIPSPGPEPFASTAAPGPDHLIRPTHLIPAPPSRRALRPGIDGKVPGPGRRALLLA